MNNLLVSLSLLSSDQLNQFRAKVAMSTNTKPIGMSFSLKPQTRGLVYVPGNYVEITRGFPRLSVEWLEREREERRGSGRRERGEVEDSLKQYW